MDAVWPTTAGGSLTDELANNVNLTAVKDEGLLRDVVCFLNAEDKPEPSHLGIRVSALFVILVVSTAVTFFPVLATRSKRFRVPLYFYLFARYFGAGVIVATAFIQ
jgi:zinc transporter 1/2/3